ncbi:MAG: iron-siderophore ABC transporter substrate-binding protein, partial [Ilumatobacteraceae bacterium]
MRTGSSLLALLTTASLLVAACGDSDGDSPDETRPAAATVATVETTAPEAAAFPVTIPHAFGETTVDAEPTRVVTWGWG